MRTLNGRRAVVTGAASGLGRAVALRFVDDGIGHLTLLDRDAAGLDEVVEELGGKGVEVRSAVVDVTDPDAVRTAVRDAASAAGGLDVMVNNAGIVTKSARVHNIAIDDLRRLLEVNFFGVFHGMQAALAIMRPAGGGSIINTASVAGMSAMSHSGAYGASKAAVIQLTKVAAVEYAPDGVRVNCVCPGTFESALNSSIRADGMAMMVAATPLGRIASATEIAGAFSYLASDDSSFVTGTALVVDGGYSTP